MVNNSRSLAVILFVFLTSQSSPGQTPAPPTGKPTAAGLIKLTGDDERGAKQLDEQIDKALNTDRWDEAIAKTEDLLTLRAKIQGPRHFETVNAEWRLRALRRLARMSKDDRDAYRSIRTLNEQADKLVAQEKHSLAQPLREKVVEILRRLLSDDHPETATAYNDLALNLGDQVKYDRAQPLYEKALEIRRRLLGDDHPDTATGYNNVGFNLNSQGKYAQAQVLFEKALAIRRRLLGDEHTDTAASYNNIAYALDAQGKYALAQPLYEKALEINRRLLGDDDPRVASGYLNLALDLNAQGKYSQAQPLYEKALEIHRRLLTDNHPRTAATYNQTASNLAAQGKYAQAQPLYEKGLEIDRRLHTDDHPAAAAAFNSVAFNLWNQGKYAEAEPLYEKALEIRRRLLGDDHNDTAISYNNVAVNLTSQGKCALAQPLFEKSLEIKRRLLTENYRNTARGYSNLASNLAAQGKYVEAQPLYEKALEINRRLLGDDHPDTAASFNTLAYVLNAQGKYAQAEPLYRKALEYRRGRLTDDHPATANSYHSLAANLTSQGKYTEAQPLYEKALEIRRRLLTEDHPETALTYSGLAANLEAQGKYREAIEGWRHAVKSMDAARLRVAFTGMERAGSKVQARLALAAVLARLGQPAEAWQAQEEDLGRSLLDELAARSDRRLSPGERARLHELTSQLESLDKLVQSTPKDLDTVERASRFADLGRQRELAKIALGEFQTKLVADHGELAGQVATLVEIQKVLPADAALVAWVDIPPTGPNAANRDGEHWGVVVRAHGVPRWVRVTGTGPEGRWTEDDTALPGLVRGELRGRPDGNAAKLQPLIKRLRAQRIEPLANALARAPEGLPPAQRLIVLPSRAMAGIPVEAVLAPDDRKTVTYAPSGTVFKSLREQPRADRHAGLFALGDPVYTQHDTSAGAEPLPDHGLLLNTVVSGSNAASHGLRNGDVLLAYNGRTLRKKDELEVVATAERPIAIEVWREGRSFARELAPGKIGAVIDPRPAPQAIAERRKVDQFLLAARSGAEVFAPLPGTRYEVEAIARLFQAADRPTQALLGADANEPDLDRLATSRDLGRFGFIHLATHGLIDEAIPERSAVILTQTGLPDPLEQALNHKPVFDGRLSVREIQRTWELKAELVTLSACETALGRQAGGEGFVGFTQALLMSGARSVCLSLWKVDDTATALLMHRFYANLLGARPGLSQPLPKAEALAEAKHWLHELRRDEVAALAANLSGGEARAKGAPKRKEVAPPLDTHGTADDDHPYAHPYYWAAFVLVGDPD